MKRLVIALAMFPLAGCVSDPNISIGQPEYIRLADNKQVPIKKA